MIPKNIDPHHGHTSNTKGALEYLDGRGISRQMQAELGIQYLTYAEAISPRWGFGKQATSPDGVIAFPVSEGVAIARNFYTSPERQAEHLLNINRQRNQQGLGPTKKVPKYVVPQGDRGKGILYDPYERLHPGTDQSVLFVTEDIFGVIKAADRGVRVLSAVGVWLVTKDELKSDDLPVFWDRVQVFMADADALENALVCRAMIRSGVVLKCKIGNFPSQSKDIKVGLDEWLDRHPHAMESELKDLVEEQTYDALDWIKGVYPNLHILLRDRGHSTTESTQIAAVVREGIQAELLQQFGLETLRSSGIYQEILKPSGVTLASLKNKAKSERSTAEGDTLLELAQQAIFFHTSDQIAYADIRIEGCRHTYPVRSKPFKMWLLEQYFALKEKGVSSQTLQDTLATLEAIAIFKGEIQEVNLRVASHGEKLYLDLGTPNWQAVEINSVGWRLVDEPPIRFTRPTTFLDLPIPEAGRLGELRGLLNIDDQAWILISTFLLFCFHPNYPKPVLILHGEQGSGKTTIAEFLKSLIDPGKAPLLPAVTDTHRMAVAASRRWLLAYDNLSGVSAEQSDALCRISTGGGFSTRTLYTTGDETVFEFIRPQILTGIDAIATRGDLLDRALMVALPSIPPEVRKTREELEIELAQARPRILGALLGAVSQTLKALPDINPGTLPRMADYAKFAIAAEAALELQPGDFLRAYQGNREETHEIALEASPVAIAIQRLMEHRTVWQGTATELIADLEQLMPEAMVRSRTWIGNPRSLGKALARLKPNLRGIGIDVDYFRSGKRGTRKIILEKLAFFLSETSALSAKTPESLPDKDSEADKKADKRLTREDLADKRLTREELTDKKRQPNVSQNVSHETLDLQGVERSADKADKADKKNAQNSKSVLKIGDIVIALKDFPGQKIGIPKGAWGEIIMPECNGLIRVQFDEGVKDVPIQDVELAS